MESRWEKLEVEPFITGPWRPSLMICPFCPSFGSLMICPFFELFSVDALWVGEALG